MQENDQPISSLQDIQDIRKIMNRSSRFISLSGLSGIAAGICALIGAFIANGLLEGYERGYFNNRVLNGDGYHELEIKLMLLAIAVFGAAFVSSFYLTWRKAKKDGMPIWDFTSKRLAWNMLVPMIAGGIFILGMLQYNAWIFVAPACLLFYGLALVNASKFTVTDIRYLGYCQIILGLINVFFVGKGLLFWSLGFGVLHIVYGTIMWMKYDRK